MRIYRSEERNPYENNWHVDGLWRENPAMGAVLRCIECPSDGGDTIWANMVEAYSRLPEDLKTRIAGLRAKDIMGFCLIVLVVSGVVIGLGLTFLP